MISYNTIIYFIGKLIPAFTTLIIMWIGVKVLGKAEFGKYNLLYNLCIITSTLGVGWIQQGMLRFSASEEGLKDESKADFNLFSMYACLFVFSIVFLACSTYFSLGILHSILVAVFALLFSFFSVRLTSLQASFLAKKYAITESAFYLMNISFILIFFYLFKIVSYTSVFGASTLALLIILTFYLRKKNFVVLQDVVSRKIFFKKIASYGFPISIWLFASGIFNVADRYIINYYYGYDVTGAYSAVYDLTYRIASFACLPLLLTYHPIITSAWNNGDINLARKTIRNSLILQFIIMTCMLLAGYFGSSVLFNDYFHLNLTHILILVIPIVVSSMVWQMALFIHKPLELLLKIPSMLLALFIALFSNIILNLILLRFFNYYWAAYTSLLCTLIYVLIVMIIIHKLDKNLSLLSR